MKCICLVLKRLTQRNKICKCKGIWKYESFNILKEHSMPSNSFHHLNNFSIYNRNFSRVCQFVILITVKTVSWQMFVCCASCLKIWPNYLYKYYFVKKPIMVKIARMVIFDPSFSITSLTNVLLNGKNIL